ncbi:MAG: FtsX-like permease family protein [Bryobacteraceae bacterium]
MAITGLLLLVTCANVANLMLARANARQKEIMVRLTVGAGRLRLIRQFLTEGVLLALCGGAVGLAIAFWACKSLLTLMSNAGAPFSLSVQPDTRVLLFTLLVSVGTALLFGLTPAWRAVRLRIESMRTRGGSVSRSRLGKTLIVFQIAVSLVLLIGAGLVVRSLENLKNFNPGFNKENVVLFSVAPFTVGYPDNQVDSLYKHMLSRSTEFPAFARQLFPSSALSDDAAGIPSRRSTGPSRPPAKHRP